MPYFHTRDETQLFYVDGGSGPPIVFAASAWLDSRMWERQIEPLVAAGFRCVAYDRRGHGRSDAPWHGYDYDTLADDLVALLEHLDLRRATLVGHSMAGGETVRAFARGGRARIAKIALVAATTPFSMQTADNPDGVPRAAMEASVAARSADRAKWYRDNAASFFGLGLPGVSASAELVDFVIGQCLTCTPHATRAAFVTAFTTDLRAELRVLDVPTLVVHGDHDEQAPLALCGQRTAELVPNGRLVVYENAAHALFLTHADRLNRDLAEFAAA